MKHTLRSALFLVALLVSAANVFASTTAGFTLSSTILCQGGAVTSTNTTVSSDSNSLVYQWYLSQQFNIQYWNHKDLPLVTAYGAGSLQIQLVVTDTLNGQTYVSSQVVTVYPNPQGQYLTSSSDFYLGCGSDTSTVTVHMAPTTGLQYVWENLGDHTTDTTLSPFQQFTQTGGYSVTIVEPTNHCASYPLNFNVYLRSLSNAYLQSYDHSGHPIVVGDTLAVCTGQTVNLFHDYSGTGNIMTSWNTGNQGDYLQVSTPGLYIATTTNGGCVAIDSVVVQYLAQPNYLFAVTPGGPHCVGDITTITGPSTPGLSYQWLYMQPADTTNVFTTMYGGIYSVQVTDQHGCQTIVPISVQYQDPPYGYILQTNCALAATTNDPSLTGLTYQWHFNNSAIAGATGQFVSIDTLSTGAGFYSCLITSTITGCSRMTNLLAASCNSVPVNPCAGVTGSTIYQDGCAMISTSTGLWTVNGQQLADTSFTIFPTQSGLYTQRTLTAGGCYVVSNSEYFSLPAIPTITVSGTTTFCQGGTVFLQAPSGTAWYWSNGSTAQNITVSDSGNYFVRVVDGTCAQNSSPVHITVHPKPLSGIIPIGSTEFCQGGSVTLQPLASSYDDTYLWNTGQVVGPITVRTEGDYQVRIESVFGCVTTTVPVHVTVHPLPAADPPQISNCHVFGTFTNNATYQWYFYLDSIIGATTRFLHVDTDGLYSYRVTSNYGCVAYSPDVNVVACGITATGINDIKPGSFTAYLDQSANQVLIKSSVELKTIDIYDIAGKRVMTENADHSFNTTINIASLASGSYILQSNNHTQRFVKISH